MKKSLSVLIMLSIIFQACDNCGECFTPPQSFQFEIVGKANGENLFTNGTFSPNDIEMTDVLNKPFGFSFVSENNINLIQPDLIGFKTEIVNLKIEISGKHIFDFYVDAESKTSDCCSYTEYNEISVRNSEFELNSQTGVYRIFVDTNTL